MIAREEPPQLELPSFNRQGYKISTAARESRLVRICEKTTELGLDTTSPEVVIFGSNKHSNEVDTESAQIGSIVRYLVIWKSLLDFCIAMGDYESGAILARKDVWQRLFSYQPSSC